ncbi:hypothetical protein NIA69_06125 [Gemmiger formicilis]|nr:hypothetical protein [Gemmiger formicilis]
MDGEFAFSLDEDTFAAAALHQDDELEDWQIEELRKKSETRRALDKAMDYLSLRDHAAGSCTRSSAGSLTPTALPTLWRGRGAGAFKRCLVCPPPRRGAAAQAQVPPRDFERSFGQGH